MEIPKPKSEILFWDFKDSFLILFFSFQFLVIFQFSLLVNNKYSRT